MLRRQTSSTSSSTDSGDRANVFPQVQVVQRWTDNRNDFAGFRPRARENLPPVAQHYGNALHGLPDHVLNQQDHVLASQHSVSIQEAAEVFVDSMNLPAPPMRPSFSNQIAYPVFNVTMIPGKAEFLISAPNNGKTYDFRPKNRYFVCCHCHARGRMINRQFFSEFHQNH